MNKNSLRQAIVKGDKDNISFYYKQKVLKGLSFLIYCFWL